jgi:hypothetical protein
MALRNLPGGWKSSIEYARHAWQNGDTVLGRVVECWDGLKKGEQASMTLEKVCELAGIPPADFFGRISAVAFSLGRDVANLVAAAAAPEVVARSVREAKKAGGFRDREALMKHNGFLPSPQGSRINIGVGFQQTIEPGPRERAGLPSIEEDNLRFTRLLRDQQDTPLLPAAGSEK